MFEDGLKILRLAFGLSLEPVDACLIIFDSLIILVLWLGILFKLTARLKAIF